MSKLLAFSITALLLLGLVAVASAQDLAKMDQTLQVVSSQLGLSDAQKQQVKDALTGFHTSCQQIKNSSMSDIEKGAAVKQMIDSGMSSFMAIFTPEQIDKALAMGAAYLKLADAKPSISVSDKAAQAAAKAGLSADQQKSLAVAYAAHCAKARAIINDSSLTESAKNEQLWALRQQNAMAAAAYLTSDQQTKAGAAFQAGRDSYMKFRSLLSPSQGEKLDALVGTAFALAEQKVTL